MLRLYMVRHGVVQKIAGHLPAYDAPLMAEQPALECLKPHIAQKAQWYVSPLMRARQSFEILAQEGSAPCPVIIDDRLEEQNFGDWHDKSLKNVWQEIARDMAPSHPVSFINPDTIPPNGTSFEAIYDNARSFLLSVIAKSASARPDIPQIIVSHAGTTKALLGHMMGLSATQAMMLAIDHGSLSCADYIYDADGPVINNAPPASNFGVGSRWHIQFINRIYS